MVNNRAIDKLIVQKVFEMSQAGNSHTEIGDFFRATSKCGQSAPKTGPSSSPIWWRPTYSGSPLHSSTWYDNQKLAPSRQNCAGMTGWFGKTVWTNKIRSAMKMIQGIAKMMPNERRVKFSWILKSPPDTFSSPTCNKWKWNKPKWKHKFCDIQPNIQQNTIPKLKGAILNAAEMTCRKVNKPGCATVRNQVTALFSLPMRLGQHVHISFSRAFEWAMCYSNLNFSHQKMSLVSGGLELASRGIGYKKASV